MYFVLETYRIPILDKKKNFELFLIIFRVISEGLKHTMRSNYKSVGLIKTECKNTFIPNEKLSGVPCCPNAPLQLMNKLTIDYMRLINRKGAFTID